MGLGWELGQGRASIRDYILSCLVYQIWSFGLVKVYLLPDLEEWWHF